MMKCIRNFNSVAIRPTVTAAAAQNVAQCRPSNLCHHRWNETVTIGKMSVKTRCDSNCTKTPSTVRWPKILYFFWATACPFQRWPPPGSIWAVNPLNCHLKNFHTLASQRYIVVYTSNKLNAPSELNYTHTQLKERDDKLATHTKIPFFE